MTKNVFLRAAIVIGVLALAGRLFFHDGGQSFDSPNEAVASDAPPAPRPAWTTSHITGAPEPPPPYVTPRVFPKLAFKHPLEMVVAPTSDRWFVVEQAGRIFSFPNRQDCAKADLFLDIPKQLRTMPKNTVLGDAYGLAFHPKFAENHYCYICYVLLGEPGDKDLPEGSRVSRFNVVGDPPRVDPASEKILITWQGGGHNGGSLKFGPDGYLYISTGDGGEPTPPDPHDTGQDISDLLSSILRIDVDHPSGNRPYSIPADNPFVHTPGARGEIWAYGLRNPWRMSFDSKTGDLWVGDVGWELWEMVDRIKKGGNYGWSIVEGPQAVHPDGKRGPTPLIAPNLAFPHSEARCIIGGYVYHGSRLKDLQGDYICGDWETHRVWATRFDGDKVVRHRVIAEYAPRVVAFGEAHDGELCILDYDLGTIHQLEPNPESASPTPFPTKLSESGLFASAGSESLGGGAISDAKRMAPGVVPFSIVAEQWADHATAERFVALPGASSIEAHRGSLAIEGSMFRQRFLFPKDSVLAKTIWMEMDRGKPESRRRLETQILHYNGHDWHGYTYRWNEEQTDATLVGSEGEDRQLTVHDDQSPGGMRVQTWHYPSRNECIVCHNPWAESRLAFTRPQLDAGDQLARLEKLGVLKWVSDPPKEWPDDFDLPQPAMVNPYDTSVDINRRARSYLQVNCSHCHRFGAGGTAEFDVRANLPLADTHLLEAVPKQGTFGIKDAQIIAPGDPYRSVLFYRMSKTGHGRMPHIGSELVDAAGVELMHDWIRGLPVRKEETSAIEQLRQLDEGTALARQQQNYPRDVYQRAIDLAHEDERDNPTEQDRKTAAEQLKKEADAQVAVRAKQRTETIGKLLSSTSSALVLSHTLQAHPLPPALHEEVVATANAHPDPQVRDLFERFVPPDKRVQRLGNVIDKTKLLAITGDAARGRALFMAGTTVQCNKCHRIEDQGGKLAPELTHVAKKYDRGQLLDKLLDPSKSIAPQYVGYLAQTKDGKTHLGVLLSKTNNEVVIRDVTDKEIHIPAGNVETLIKQTRSLMPDGQLRDLTPQQAADLLAFLGSLK